MPMAYEGAHRNRDWDRDRVRRPERERERRNDYEEYDRYDRDRSRDRGRDDRYNERRDFDGDYRLREDHFDEGSTDRVREDRAEESFDRPGGRRDAESWKSDIPSHTILLRGLPNHIEEADIWDELSTLTIPVKDIRLVTHKGTGSSRGFAFIEFHTVDEAVRWMERQQGELYLMDRYRCSMVYSKSGGSSAAKNDTRTALLPDPPRADWTCAKCGILNFARRDKCFKCTSRRSEAEETVVTNKSEHQGDGSDQIGTNPCNTLIFRGLDALTTEDNVKAALAALTAIVPKNVHILRDVYTGSSLGYCFVEFGTVQESCQLMEYLPGRNFEVDGKLIFVNYAKNTYSTIMASLAHWNQQGWDYERSKGDTYYYQQQQASGTTGNSSIAQAAIQQAQALSQAGNAAAVAASATPQTPSDPWIPTQQKQYPDPDVTAYQYDASSGYYYDPVTGLYYDANTQYYYSSQIQQFLYWDGEKKNYIPAPSTQATPVNETKKDEKDKEKDKEKKEKVKHAKKVAKEMENWAKKLNAQKQAILEAKKPQLLPAQSAAVALAEANSSAAEKSTADAAYALLVEKSGGDKFRAPLPPSFATPKAAATSPEDHQKQSVLVASYGGDSDSDERDEDEPPGGARRGGAAPDETKLIDYSKLACLLCKRQFNSKEILEKHTQMSELHKQNLAKLTEQAGTAASQNNQHYRDRAKERRQKYGAVDEKPRESWKNNAGEANGRAPSVQPVQPLMADQPPSGAAGGDDNVGSKLMQKMGWNAGQGLGRANQGIVQPIEAEYNGAVVNTAGLGSRSRNIGLQPGDTYCDAVRKTFYARYNDL